MPGPLDCKVYVGDLGSEASKQDLEDIFSYYGRLRNVWVARNPPGFAFVEFEDGRDAEDAVRGLDGRSICGRRARIELSKGKSRNHQERGPPPRRGRPFNSDDTCYKCGDRGHYARDCNSSSRRSRSRSRSPRRRSNSRSRSRDPSRSRSRGGRSKSASRGRSRSRNRSLSVSRSRGRGRSGSPRKGRSSSRSRSQENGS